MGEEQRTGMIKFLQQREQNELTYWAGLVLLFLGLCFEVSVARACVVVGGVLALESVVTSYIAIWKSE
jgi:hypothetical protein